MIELQATLLNLNYLLKNNCYKNIKLYKKFWDVKEKKKKHKKIGL